MLIRDILEDGAGKPVVSVPASLPLLEAVRLLRDADAGAIVVIEDGVLTGVLSERALVNAVATRGAGIALITVADAMDTSVLTCSLDDDITETLDLMSSSGVRHVPVLKGGVPVTMLSAREFKSACRFLKTQAETDELTGLANRRSFLRDVERELDFFSRTRAPMAVAMLDLDVLKKINDKLGHAAGDALLRLVARALARETRSIDHVARIGGDEFAILFPQTRLHNAVIACRRIVAACSALPLPRVDGVYQVTLSAGVTVARARDTADLILRRADESLYAAKASGRGRVVASRTSPGEGLPVVPGAIAANCAEPANRNGVQTASAVDGDQDVAVSSSI